MKARDHDRIVSAAVIIAVGVNGRREVLGMDIGPSEAETFWTVFLRKLRRRGLRGVKLVVSDAHEGIKAAVAKVTNASWQRCRVHCKCRSYFPHKRRSKIPQSGGDGDQPCVRSAPPFFGGRPRRRRVGGMGAV